MTIPSHLLYTAHDEWVLLEGDLLTLGITDYAQDALGELVYVGLPQVGDQVAAGEQVCEVESTKAVAEVYCPVAGQVVKVNQELEAEASTINSDPYGSGWLVQLRIEANADPSGLMSAQDYAANRANA